MQTQTLSIGQIIPGINAQFRVKSLKGNTIPFPAAVAKNVGKNAIKLQVIDWSNQAYDVKLIRNSYIAIECFYTNHIKPKQTSITFKIGDTAEYGSCNMSYMGEITAITDKTVTIVEYKGTRNERTHRLKLADFCSRNWDFDLAKNLKRNHEWMD